MKNLSRPCRTAVALLCLSLGTAAWSQSASPTLTRIGERGQINIGHRESATPFSYFDEGKQVSGFSVELCGRVLALLQALPLLQSLLGSFADYLQ